jgi:hypothetical protein
LDKRDSIICEGEFINDWYHVRSNDDNKISF